MTGTSVISCSDYLDINQDPNYVTEGTLATLYPSAAATTIARLGYQAQLFGDLWCQFVTQGNTTNQYNTTTNYQVSSTDFQDIWRNAYANTLQDLKIALALAEKEGAWNYWLLCKVLTAYNYHILTDLYGDIPFTEALNAEFPKPKYDNSKTVVYPGILAMLDEAIAKETDAKANTNPVIGNLDYYFQGDINKWVAFAKTLKLKILMRDFEANKSAITALLNAGGLLESDCVFTQFEDAADKGNPFYEQNIRQLNTRENLRASHTMIEFLLANNDPRITKFYEVTTAAQDLIDKGSTLTLRQMYEGLPQGTKPIASSNEEEDGVLLIESSRYMQAYSDPVYLMNSAEVAFMEAEAYARLGDAAKAKERYDIGVTRAFGRWNMDATSFLEGPYKFDASSLDTMLKCIMTQKWVSYGKANSWDGAFDRNRTGIPAISTAEKVRVSNRHPEQGLAPGYVLGTLVAPGTTVLQPMDFPRHLLVPDASSLYNENAPDVTPVQIPLWWQVAAGK